jgi:hypothetical protein
MSKPLTDRIQDATKAVIVGQLATEQVLTFGDTTKAEKAYTSVRAISAGEDPPGSGIFVFDVTVIMHGDHDDADTLTLETIFNNSYAFAAALRAAGSTTFVMPQGEAVEIEQSTRSGVGLDTETTFTFGCWAQTKEVSDAA